MTDSEKLKTFYDGVYAEGDIHDNRKLYAWIARLFQPVRGKKFLDVACGGGWLLKEAEKLGLQAHGIDISVNAVTRADLRAMADSGTAPRAL